VPKTDKCKKKALQWKHTEGMHQVPDYCKKSPKGTTGWGVGLLRERSQLQGVQGRALALRRHPNAYLWKANAFEGQAEALHQLANGLIQQALALHQQAQALNQKAKALHLRK
ncbi:hypothetical protein Tco_1230618, partial [Tanacetum coccineum]